MTKELDFHNENSSTAALAARARLSHCTETLEYSEEIALPLSTATPLARFQPSLTSKSLTNLEECTVTHYFFQRKDPESHRISIRCLHLLLWLELKAPEKLQY